MCPKDYFWGTEVLVGAVFFHKGLFRSPPYAHTYVHFSEEWDSSNPSRAVNHRILGLPR